MLRGRYVTVFLVIAFFLLDLVLLGRACDLTKSDWAAWLGAVGTVGTLVGTIWLATDQSRRQQDDAVLKARLYSAHMMLRLATAKGELSQGLNCLKRGAAGELQANSVLNIASYFRAAKLWTIDELIPMAPLPGNIAGKLAEALDQVALVISLIEQTNYNGTLGDPFEIQSFCQKLRSLVEGTIEFVDDGIAGCDAARTQLHAATSRV